MKLTSDQRAQLTEARKSRGLTRREIANLVGVRRVTYASWENGNASPGLARLMTLLHAFPELQPLLLGDPDVPNYERDVLMSIFKTPLQMPLEMTTNGHHSDESGS